MLPRVGGLDVAAQPAAGAADEEMRLRRADEATDSTLSVEHTRFIVSVNVGVGGKATTAFSIAAPVGCDSLLHALRRSLYAATQIFASWWLRNSNTALARTG